MVRVRSLSASQDSVNRFGKNLDGRRRVVTILMSHHRIIVCLPLFLGCLTTKKNMASQKKRMEGDGDKPDLLMTTPSLLNRQGPDDVALGEARLIGVLIHGPRCGATDGRKLWPAPAQGAPTPGQRRQGVEGHLTAHCAFFHRCRRWSRPPMEESRPPALPTHTYRHHRPGGCAFFCINRWPGARKKGYRCEGCQRILSADRRMLCHPKWSLSLLVIKNKKKQMIHSPHKWKNRRVDQ